MRGRLAALSAAVAVVSAAPAWADDSSQGVMLPGWRAGPPGPVAVAAAAVLLKGDQATVALTVAGRRPGPTRLTLTTPRFGWLGEGEPYPDRQFPELAVTLDGRPLQMKDSFKAFAGPADVTALLYADRLDPFAVALTPPYLEPRDPPEQALAELEQAGAVRRTDGKVLAAWSVERTVAVTVPAGSEAVLATAWRARPAFDYLPAVGARPRPGLSLYCLDAPGLARALGRPVTPGALVAREYAFAVGIDGRAPPTASLDVTGKAQDEGARLLVAACDPDGRPVIGKDGLTDVRVRPGADGSVHVLAVGDASAHD